MTDHVFTTRLSWRRQTPGFAYEIYDRNHDVTTGSGVRLAMSAAPAFRGDPARLNPEEQLVAALSSCHALTFLAIAAKKRLIVDDYEDDATGVMEKDERGKLAVTRVTLRPKVTFSGEHPPSDDDVRRIHELAHEECFIASSVRTSVVVEAR